jgi:hypothetical protein
MASGPIPFSQWAKKQRPSNPAQSNALSRDDFIAHSPNHTYIYLPTGEAWTGEAVNSRIPPIAVPGLAKPMPASRWIDQNNAVEQRTGSPGDPQIISDRLTFKGGWIDKPGARIYNSYLPPTIVPSNNDVTPWQELVCKTYPDDHDHIFDFLSHTAQHPGDKINHALMLGGPPGIGKDTLLQAVIAAVGPWNCAEISPSDLLAPFNPFRMSVFLRLSEGKDQGEHSRYEFYERTKTLLAAPPDMIRISEKHIPHFHVPNCCNVVITTNHKISGIYLPPDDRRHYVAWSLIERPAVDINGVWKFYVNGGLEAVAGFLLRRDLSKFDPKAEPPKTAAFWEIAHSMRPAEQGDMGTVIEKLGVPDVLTLKEIIACAASNIDDQFSQWLRDRKNSRSVSMRLDECGYRVVRNPDAANGLWLIRGARANIYVHKRIGDKAALKLAREHKDAGSDSSEDADADFPGDSKPRGGRDRV